MTTACPVSVSFKRNGINNNYKKKTLFTHSHAQFRVRSEGIQYNILHVSIEIFK